MQVRTPTGYRDVTGLSVGDAVSAFDLATGAPITNTIEAIERWPEQHPWPKIYDGPELFDEESQQPISPNLLETHDAQYLINGVWRLYEGQSIWVAQDGAAGGANVVHARDLQVGNVIYDGSDNPVTVTSVAKLDDPCPAWTRFKISGDHSYIARDDADSPAITLHNASRFGVGGGASTNWNATGNTNWSASSGGSNNASVPGSSDDVFLDTGSNSGWAASNLSSTISIVNLDFTGYTGTFSNSGAASALICSGTTIKLSTGMTITWSSVGSLSLTSTSGTTVITTFGKQLGGASNTTQININGAGGTFGFADAVLSTQKIAVPAGSLVLTRDLTCGTLLLNGAGTIDSTGFAISATTFQWSAASGALTLGTSFTVSTSWNNSSTGTTFNKGSCNIKMTGAGAKTFAGGGLTYNNFWCSPGSDTGKLTVTGANTFADFKDDGTAAHQIQFPASTTQSMTSFTVSGAGPSAKISLISSSAGTRATLSQASGTVSSSYLDIKDSAATGGATWNATHSNDSGNNSGWNISGDALAAHPLVIDQAVQRAANW